MELAKMKGISMDHGSYYIVIELKTACMLLYNDGHTDYTLIYILLDSQKH